MVDENRNTTASDSQSGLPPPRFDEHAHLKAQPVTPIPKNKLTVFFERASQMFAGSLRSLALVVVLGVATGGLVGMALVNDRHSALPQAADQASVLTEVVGAFPLEEAEVGVYGIQTSRANIKRTGGRRSYIQSNGQPRAYRFAVIR